MGVLGPGVLAYFMKAHNVQHKVHLIRRLAPETQNHPGLCNRVTNVLTGIGSGFLGGNKGLSQACQQRDQFAVGFQGQLSKDVTDGLIVPASGDLHVLQVPKLQEVGVNRLQSAPDLVGTFCCAASALGQVHWR